MLFLADELASDTASDTYTILKSLNMENALEKVVFRLSLAGSANTIVKNSGRLSPLRYAIFHITDLSMLLFGIFVLPPSFATDVSN